MRLAHECRSNGGTACNNANSLDQSANFEKMTEGIVPISLDERRARIEKARRLMREHRIDAIYLEPGAEHVLLHRHALGHERAHVCAGDSGARRDRLGLSEV